MWVETLGAEMGTSLNCGTIDMDLLVGSRLSFFRESHTECDLIGSSALPALTQSAGARMTYSHPIRCLLTDC